MPNRYAPQDFATRFWSKVNKDGPLWEGTPCWLWTDHRRDGYGSIYGEDKRNQYAHRIAYTIIRGPIPEGLQIDHLCRVRHCVNPKHLEPVTAYENWRRGNGPAAINARRTHCKRGHPFTAENTRMKQSSRVCRQCHALESKERRLTAVLRALEGE